MKTCPHIEAVFEVLGRKWNGRIIHYVSTCQGGAARFSEMEGDVGGISPRALSLKLAELIGYGLIEKQARGESSATVSYALTEKGWTLVEAMKPLQDWARVQMSRPERSAPRAPAPAGGATREKEAREGNEQDIEDKSTGNKGRVFT